MNIIREGALTGDPAYEDRRADSHIHESVKNEIYRRVGFAWGHLNQYIQDDVYRMTRAVMRGSADEGMAARAYAAAAALPHDAAWHEVMEIRELINTVDRMAQAFELGEGR